MNFFTKYFVIVNKCEARPVYLRPIGPAELTEPNEPIWFGSVLYKYGSVSVFGYSVWFIFGF